MFYFIDTHKIKIWYLALQDVIKLTKYLTTKGSSSKDCYKVANHRAHGVWSACTPSRAQPGSIWNEISFYDTRPDLFNYPPRWASNGRNEFLEFIRGILKAILVVQAVNFEGMKFRCMAMLAEF